MEYKAYGMSFTGDVMNFNVVTNFLYAIGG